MSSANDFANFEDDEDPSPPVLSPKPSVTTPLIPKVTKAAPHSWLPLAGVALVAVASVGCMYHYGDHIRGMMFGAKV
eukprot:SAG11_NODE_31234_length_293_cov_1.556701_1_plen_76_part_01